MITIVDYAAGNPTSVKRALWAVGVDSVISAEAEAVRVADRIIVPGVGRARATMAVLEERGLDQALKDAFQRGTPILGVCIGAQVSLSHSEEDDTPCLGLVPGRVRRIPKLDDALKIPHMGWNRIQLRSAHPVLAEVPEANEFYFVHSFYPDPDDAEQVISVTEHGITFASAFAHENLVATQFHPEKSGALGLQLFERFCNWRP
jgi:glutamine amidotransferase